jgi:hypothetical protein
MKWSTTGAIVYNLDQGTLGLLSNAQARALIAAAFAEWTAAAPSLTFAEGASLPQNVDAAGIPFTNPAHFQNFYRVSGDGRSPVIFDADGSIIDAIFGVGARFEVLGVAGLDTPVGATTEITEGSIIINGAFFDGVGLPTSPRTSRAPASSHDGPRDRTLSQSRPQPRELRPGPRRERGERHLRADDVPRYGGRRRGARDHEPGRPARGAEPLSPGSADAPDQRQRALLRNPLPGSERHDQEAGRPAHDRLFPDLGRPVLPLQSRLDVRSVQHGVRSGNPAAQGAFGADFFPAGPYRVCVEQIDTRLSLSNSTFVGPLATPPILLGPEECFDVAEAGTQADDPDDAAPVIAGGGVPADFPPERPPLVGSLRAEQHAHHGGRSRRSRRLRPDTAPALLGSGDLDVYQVPVTAGQRVRIDIDAAELGSTLDVVIGFYNASNVLVARVDDALDPDSQAFSLDPALELTASFTGIGKIVVSSYPDFGQTGSGGATTGPYWIRVEVESDTDGDGVADGSDICPATARDDEDRDGRCFGADNCPTESNPLQYAPQKISGTMVSRGDVSFYKRHLRRRRDRLHRRPGIGRSFQLYSVPTAAGAHRCA